MADESDSSKALAPWEEGAIPSIFSTLSDPIDTINAIGDAARLEDFLGKPIDLVHLVAHDASVTDPQTGEIIPVTRTVLIDKNGKGYASVSGALVSSLRMVFGTLGQNPPFSPPIKIVVEQKPAKRGRVYRVRVVK